MCRSDSCLEVSKAHELLSRVPPPKTILFAVIDLARDRGLRVPLNLMTLIMMTLSKAPLKNSAKKTSVAHVWHGFDKKMNKKNCN